MISFLSPFTLHHLNVKLPNSTAYPFFYFLQSIQVMSSADSRQRSSSSQSKQSLSSTHPAPVFTSTAAPLAASHVVPSVGGGLKIKIRNIAGTISVASSDDAPTNTISSPSSGDEMDGSSSSSSSSSSSRDTSPFSSRRGSDAETAARRYAAIPPAFITNKSKNPPSVSVSATSSNAPLSAQSTSLAFFPSSSTSRRQQEHQRQPETKQPQAQPQSQPQTEPIHIPKL